MLVGAVFMVGVLGLGVAELVDKSGCLFSVEVQRSESARGISGEGDFHFGPTVGSFSLSAFCHGDGGRVDEVDVVLGS